MRYFDGGGGVAANRGDAQETRADEVEYSKDGSVTKVTSYTPWVDRNGMARFTPNTAYYQVGADQQRGDLLGKSIRSAGYDIPGVGNRRAIDGDPYALESWNLGNGGVGSDELYGLWGAAKDDPARGKPTQENAQYVRQLLSQLYPDKSQNELDRAALEAIHTSTDSNNGYWNEIDTPTNITRAIGKNLGGLSPEHEAWLASLDPKFNERAQKITERRNALDDASSPGLFGDAGLNALFSIATAAIGGPMLSSAIGPIGAGAVLGGAVTPTIMSGDLKFSPEGALLGGGGGALSQFTSGLEGGSGFTGPVEPSTFGGALTPSSLSNIGGKALLNLLAGKDGKQVGTSALTSLGGKMLKGFTPGQYLAHGGSVGQESEMRYFAPGGGVEVEDYTDIDALLNQLKEQDYTQAFDDAQIPELLYPGDSWTEAGYDPLAYMDQPYSGGSDQDPMHSLTVQPGMEDQNTIASLLKKLLGVTSEKSLAEQLLKFGGGALTTYLARDARNDNIAANQHSAAFNSGLSAIGGLGQAKQRTLNNPYNRG